MSWENSSFDNDCEELFYLNKKILCIALGDSEGAPCWIARFDQL